MKIVIIGSESFVGKELKKHCDDKGIDYVGLDLAASDDPHYHQVDMCSKEAIDVIPENADAFVHLAAISRDKDCREDTIGAFNVNINGTLNMIKAAKDKKAKQFIFASSEWVYGNCAPDSVQTEDDPIDITKMTSVYAMTKILGERLLYVANQDGLCPVTVLRFGIIYGPRPKPQSAVEGLFNEVHTLDKVEMGCSLKSGRRFLHVSDVADGILSALGRTEYEVFNLQGDGVITFREIIDKSMEIWGTKPEVVEGDPSKLNLRNPDNQKIKKALNWEPKIDIEKGLADLKAHQEQ